MSAPRARVGAGSGRPVGRAWIAALAAAALLAGGLGAWALVGDVPFVVNPFRTVPVPAYLDSEHPAVVAAQDQASSQEDLLVRLSERLAVHSGERELLWNSLDQFAREPALSTWLNGKQVEFADAEAWQVPADPDWTEDPFDNISWLSYYHSLAWLQAPGRLYVDDPTASQYRDQVAAYLLDWIAENPRDAPPSIRSWYDHTVAWRTDTIVSLFDPVLLGTLDARQLDTVLEFLWRHGDLLHGYLRNAAFTGHNHSMFHALSLYNLAVSFPELAGSDEWKSDAHARIGTLLGEMLDDDGASTEQAAGYQFLALSLFRTANAYFEAHGDPLSAEVAEVVSRAADYAALLTWPDGTLPPYGDTGFGASANRALLEDVASSGTGSPELTYLLSRGAQGQRPADLHVYDESGYSLIRPTYGDLGSWIDDLHVFFDLGRWRRAHGHEDSMNVLVYGAGGPLLVDSGGPYVYGDIARRGFVSPQAHNTVVVDDRGYDAEDLDALDGRLLGSADDGELVTVDAAHDQWGTVSHRRTVILIKPSVLVVVDRLTPLDGRSHLYELLWHLPPGTVVASDSNQMPWSGTATTPDRAAMGIAVAASSNPAYELVEGRQERPLGWVATGILRREAAPVLSHRLNGESAWYVTVIAPAHGTVSAAAPTVFATADGEAIHVTIEAPAGSWQLRIPDGEGQMPHAEAID